MGRATTYETQGIQTAHCVLGPKVGITYILGSQDLHPNFALRAHQECGGSVKPGMVTVDPTPWNVDLG